MGSSGVDLYKPAFWLVAGLAIVLLSGLKNATARKWVFALANLGFIGLHVSPPTLKFILLSLAGLVAAAVVICTLLRIVQAGYVRLPLAAGGIAVLALFVLHKLPSVLSTGGASPLNSVLITIGFSYVALRLVDLAQGGGRRRSSGSRSDCTHQLRAAVSHAGGRPDPGLWRLCPAAGRATGVDGFDFATGDRPIGGRTVQEIHPGEFHREDVSHWISRRWSLLSARSPIELHLGLPRFSRLQRHCAGAGHLNGRGDADQFQPALRGAGM